MSGKRETILRVLRQARRTLLFSTAPSSSSPTQSSSSSITTMASRDARRLFSSSSSPHSSASNPSTRGPVSYVSLGLTLATGAGVMYWYTTEKQKKLETVLKKDAVVVGQASIGGPFSLIDMHGKPFTEQNLQGQFSVIYFGFTHCPDICPEELEKVASAINIASEKTGAVSGILPVFITIDPERDGTAEVREYVKEFHPRMIGLTGSPDAVREAAKQYRVYYTKASLGEVTGATGKAQDNDYLVDHSIITYLLDPEGRFITFYGKNYTDKEMADSLSGHIQNWMKTHPEWLNEGKK